MSAGDYDYRYAYITSTATTATNSTWNYYTAPSGIIDTGVDELKAKVKELENLFFRKVVSRCPACGQWGAAMCECKHCGHPIDMGEMPNQKDALSSHLRKEIINTKNMVGETGVQGELGLTGETGIQGCWNNG
jgi:hypothetical protein